MRPGILPALATETSGTARTPPRIMSNRACPPPSRRVQKTKTARAAPSAAMPPPRQNPARWGGGVPPPLTLPPSKMCSRSIAARRAKNRASCVVRASVPGSPSQPPIIVLVFSPGSGAGSRCSRPRRPRSAPCKALPRSLPGARSGLAGALRRCLPSPFAALGVRALKNAPSGVPLPRPFGAPLAGGRRSLRDRPASRTQTRRPTW